VRYPSGESVLARCVGFQGVHPSSERIHLAGLEVAPKEQLALRIGEDHPAVSQLDRIADHAEFGWKPDFLSQHGLTLGRPAGNAGQEPNGAQGAQLH
jgi:hypothetical protein